MFANLAESSLKKVPPQLICRYITAPESSNNHLSALPKNVYPHCVRQITSQSYIRHGWIRERSARSLVANFLTTAFLVHLLWEAFVVIEYKYQIRLFLTNLRRWVSQAGILFICLFFLFYFCGIYLRIFRCVEELNDLSVAFLVQLLISNDCVGKKNRSINIATCFVSGSLFKERGCSCYVIPFM